MNIVLLPSFSLMVLIGDILSTSGHSLSKWGTAKLNYASLSSLFRLFRFWFIKAYSSLLLLIFFEKSKLSYNSFLNLLQGLSCFSSSLIFSFLLVKSSSLYARLFHSPNILRIISFWNIFFCNSPNFSRFFFLFCSNVVD